MLRPSTSAKASILAPREAEEIGSQWCRELRQCAVVMGVNVLGAGGKRVAGSQRSGIVQVDMTLAVPPIWCLTCSRAHRAVSMVRGANSRLLRVSLIMAVTQS